MSSVQKRQNAKKPLMIRNCYRYWTCVVPSSRYCKSGATYPPGLRKDSAFSLFGARNSGGCVIGAVFAGVFPNHPLALEFWCWRPRRPTSSQNHRLHHQLSRRSRSKPCKGSLICLGGAVGITALSNFPTLHCISYSLLVSPNHILSSLCCLVLHSFQSYKQSHSLQKFLFSVLIAVWTK